MLNPFPDLLTYSQLAPFILRVILGLIFVDLAFLKFGREKIEWKKRFEALGLRPADILVALYAILQFAAGIMLIAGFYTQIAALIIAIFSGTELYIEYKNASILKRDLVFYILIFAIAISLLLTGAGAFAFDIPL